MIEIVLLTGFLGTGKTSLINGWLAALDDTSRIGVVVNEAGDTPFDGTLIAEVSGDASSVRMLGNGCLCCQAGDDLAQAIRAIDRLHRERTGRHSARIIVEASGIALPGALLRQLQAVHDLPLSVHVVATVDAARPIDAAAPGEIRAQWAGAGTLVVTRMGLPSADPAGALAAARAVNPLARVVVEPKLGRAGLLAFAPDGSVDPVFVPEAEQHSSDIAVFTLQQTGHSFWADYEEWFDNLAGLAGDRLLRVKALLRPALGPARLIQAVGSTFSLPRPIETEAAGHVVVIARDFDAAEFATIEPAGLLALPHTNAHAHAHV